MAPAASRAARTGGTTPVASRTTITARVPIAGVDPAPSGTVWRRTSSGESTTRKSRSRSAASSADQSPSRSSTSPARELGVVRAHVLPLALHRQDDERAPADDEPGSDSSSDQPGARRNDDLGRPRLAAQEGLLDVGGGTHRLDRQCVVSRVSASHRRITDDGEPVPHRHNALRHRASTLPLENRDDADARVVGHIPATPGCADERRGGWHPQVEDVIERVLPNQRGGLVAQVRRQLAADAVRQEVDRPAS